MRIIIEIDAEEKETITTTQAGATGNTTGEADTVETAPRAGAEPLDAGPAAPVMEEEAGEPQGLPADAAAAAGPETEADLAAREEAIVRAGEAAGGISAGAAPEIE